MTAEELIKAGRLLEARTLLIEEVKAKPSNVGARTVLFQVLSLLGEWDKALRHLDMISTQEPGRMVGVRAYLDIINAEKERINVINGNSIPSLMPGTPEYFTDYVEYLGAIRSGNFDQARSLFIRIDNARPIVEGTMNSISFSGFCDTDNRLFAFLEAFVHERYVWIPIESVRELVIQEPKTFFDLIWIMASITTWEGLSINCFLPVVYPETFLSQDDELKTGRLTEWVNLGGGLSKALGQHMFQIGEEDFGILDIREVNFKMPVN